ncbi:MAG: dihydrolipoyl dehydrogenase [Clostridiaceae bacterium]|nr:dihydrolipoyl dehydrogenase [Clostridiaceae bacterium]
MKTEQLILTILKKLDDSLDENNPDFSDLTSEKLGISKYRRSYILEMMQEAGLIKGVNFVKGGNDRAPNMVLLDNMQITLRGVMYLADNTTTAKIVKAAKLLKDVIPGI